MVTGGKLLLLLIMSVMLGLAISDFVDAQGASSNFRIDESDIGPGSQLDSSSSNYQFESGQQSVGSIGVGENGSTNFQTQNGPITTADPRLQCLINTAAVNFGSLSTSVTATGTATFKVLNYTAYGYVVNIIGNPPSYSGHTLTNLAANAASTPGTEQFGINLVANTAPITFGADPVQVPSNTFSFGSAATNYNTTNSYRYVNGETIASATRSSGETDYTISYIVNVSTISPSGSYSGNQVILCTGTF
jgi:hypothetical protein